MSNVTDELSACLALQKEIDEKTLELRKRFKAVLEAERSRGNKDHLMVEIDGALYVLEREDNSKKWLREASKAPRELGGFYFYRLFKVAKHVS
jgi:hypothetical protein